MSPKLYILVAVIVVALSASASADIFKDLLSWDFVSTFTGVSDKKESKNTATRDDDEDDNTTGCDCEGKGCNCCVDFNITSIIDLGGPGCVRMLYISQEEGVSLNVSYGDSLLHSKIVNQKDKKGSCMDLLSEFAQICARFDALKPTEDGLQGCLHFEPHVLGEVTAQYHVGCFRMNSHGMVQDTTLTPAEENSSDVSQPNEEEDEEDGDEEETPSILEVVNQSAEQGIAFFSDLLGLTAPGKKTKTTTEKRVPATSSTTEAASESEEESSDSDSESRSFSSVKTSLGRSHFTNQLA